MQRLTCVVFINLANYGKRLVSRSQTLHVPAVRVINSRFRSCTSLVPRSWYLAWERDYMCACVHHYKMASFATDSSHRVL